MCKFLFGIFAIFSLILPGFANAKTVKSTDIVNETCGWYVIFGIPVYICTGAPDVITV